MFDERDRLDVQQKQGQDFVTEADRKAEAFIIHEIQHHYPSHGIVAEESGCRNPDAPVQWYIDPLDGTNNFVHGYPHFSVSIAAWKQGKPLLGVIHDPIRNETFEAQNGNGAFLNRKRMRVSQRKEMSEAFFASGLPAYRRQQLPAFQRRMEACMQVTAGYRRSGSAALDLAYVAAGRLDAYWECGLGAWDIAAGAILVQEAGGMVSDIEGAGISLEKGDVLAANPGLHEAFRKILVTHSDD